ncbi:MAG: peptide-methionine (R)-S-oxide reductase MsrB [Deinococcales bacterium]|mgnify:CR=1 FL=1|nr:peptide-methionine (R)-S-oxide reductase MsrB [Deinococcales bacterium]
MSDEPRGKNEAPAFDPASLKQRLTPLAWHVTQEAGTERPFTGEFWDHFAPGSYACVVCGTELFEADDKFRSDCGWPSFSDVAAQGRITTHDDRTHGMHRIEVRCGTCGAHLGHVFPDGPEPTGLRYCINSVALTFEQE